VAQVNEYSGSLVGTGRRIALLVSRFNGAITERLVEGARDCLVRHGVADGDIDVVRVPGAWELPATAARVAELHRHDAIIALGCVIRGATPHFDHVAGEASSGLGAVARQQSIPVIFGVLTTDTIEQAVERAGTKAGNKGWDAALSALEMINLYGSLE
jgi:6,7-dimethyl-8-ribityllumazine synthase